MMSNSNLFRRRLSCRELRSVLFPEWPKLYRMSCRDVYNYIRCNYNCTSYAAKTLSKEFSRGY